jgi:hypothetical protein
MIDFIRKSVIRKLIAYIVLLFAFLGIFFYLTKVLSLENLNIYQVIGILGFLIIIFILIYSVDIIKPFRVILNEIQLLLTGKEYKRIFTSRIDEFGILARFFNQVTSGLGKVSLDLKEKERMFDELTIAAKLQRDILPLNCYHVPGLQIIAKNKQATEVGGDSFNIINIGDKTYVYVGDVTGHGVAAGLIMTMVNSLISVFTEIYNNPYDVVKNVNFHIKKHVKRAMYMTMVLMCWDQTNKKLYYVGAGHEHILVYNSTTGKCDAILTGGVALGMIPDNSNLIMQKEINIEDGDFVVLYTDGITEARNNNEELYGLERLRKSVEEYAPQYNAEGLNYHIAKDVSNFMDGHEQMDDMTLIVMKRDESIKEIDKNNEKSTNW